MEPVTHALASAALARGAFDGTRLAAPTAIVASLAVDLDWTSLAGGAEAYLKYHRVVTHSLAGSAVLAIGTAVAFWALRRKHTTKPASLARLLAVALGAAWLHVLLDVLNPHGVALLWPFNAQRYSWDLADMLDPWLLAILLTGWLLPTLLRLVTEEIGAKAEGKGPRRWALGALALAALYCGGRWHFHDNAVALLDSRVYHGAPPLTVAALPDSPSPLLWRGLAQTANTYEEVEAPTSSGAYFDSDRSVTHYKPEPSPALDAAQKSAAVQAFVAASRFPLARIETLGPGDGLPNGGYRVTIRDLRFSARTTLERPVVVIVDMDAEYRVLDERFEFQDRN